MAVSRRKKKTLTIMASLIALISVLITSSYAKPTNNQTPESSKTKSSQPETVKPKPKRYGYPVRLRIAKIGVEAKVQYLALTDDNDLDVPSNITDVGWYKLGVRPGNVGSAVIDGHFNGPKGEPGVFNRLTELKKGDRVLVNDNKGNTINFLVRKTKAFEPDEQPKEVFSSSKGVHLNLITCSGEWSSKDGQYSKRTVVFTDLIE